MRLRVDESALSSMMRGIRDVRTGFEDVARRRDEAARIWGADEVRDAMSDFAGDWDRHRRLLGEDLAAFEERVAAAVRTFDGVDQELSEVLVRAQAGPAADGPAPGTGAR